MKVRIKRALRQVCLAALVSLPLSACNMKKGEKLISPPLTFPLSQSYIGYGIINASYTQVNVSTEENSASVGYLRQGSVVRIIERRLVKNEGKTEAWVLVDGTVKGWLKESLIDIYSNESQAVTASEQIRNEE
jgi:mannose-6-phosphate isomerase-like protein (cupin superfamily)